MLDKNKETISVLLVDDEKVDRKMVVQNLDALNLSINIVEADNVDDAVGHLKKTSFDCIFSEFRLGMQNAFDLINLLDQEIDQMQGIIILTAFGNEAIAAEAIKRNASLYMTKDKVSPESLSEAIEHTVAKVRHSRERELERQKLTRLSLYDQLTGLPNRNLFFDRISNLIEIGKRENNPFTLLMIDLNGFKQINDQFGHKIGDELLKITGQRLNQAARDSDTFARLGGDEFVALLPCADSIEAAVTIASKLQAAITQPIVIDGQNLDVNSSIGIAQYPAHGQDTETLLHHADLAMYESKATGADFVIFENEDCVEQQKNFCIANTLSELGEGSNLVLNYLPKVSLTTGQLTGAEVLIRWRHPELGLLPPSEFIPAAERSSVIRDLTFKVIEQAARQYVIWKKVGMEIPLSVNLSSNLLSDDDLAGSLLNILNSFEMPSSALQLEVTETALLSNPEAIRNQMSALHDHGFKISLDDFGMGFSSLQYLKQCKFDEIKIDRSFINQAVLDPQDTSLISTIINLAQVFKVDCVAEGIEDWSSWELLQDLGCEFGQGFNISPPLPADSFPGWKIRWENTITMQRIERNIFEAKAS